MMDKERQLSFSQLKTFSLLRISVVFTDTSEGITDEQTYFLRASERTVKVIKSVTKIIYTI